MDQVLGWLTFTLIFASIPVVLLGVTWALHRRHRGLDKKPLEVFRDLRNRGQITHEVYERLRREFQG